jgi:hypothetical protein
MDKVDSMGCLRLPEQIVSPQCTYMVIRYQMAVFLGPGISDGCDT